VFAPNVTLTREELYEKVWTTPMHKLAAEFCFSGGGFAKLCRRHQIPVPLAATGPGFRLAKARSARLCPP
jgi:hypothetical protein